MPTPIDASRERTCVRCNTQFTERAGRLTRICDRCRRRTPDAHDATADGTVVGRRRERTCIRCDSGFTEGSGEISRLCPACDSDHVLLE
ncbi:hypothetical protein [Haloplanus halobius]|uniref:hypothetical protein n=1 Tax=Haloplanus halobius TaxID=2934938 RepID=UPI00200BBCE8|nr:hypothetical protein [Haloplanus sp. XH21]